MSLELIIKALKRLCMNDLIKLKDKIEEEMENRI